ncbi:hypothetical protein LC087_07210 [Bacillus carboniphilus]|uniref:Uncharacterized protein n=1 Tax=Bacillus carboniphilus TaxID=86663 RepID=A0ABY9JYQ3_9BACI|nr:hypothetical protein [Bacillus carboniphilus]WLR43898.1 hypothetical protein LC087_07210 [Bacillus carboniphilus]
MERGLQIQFTFTDPNALDDIDILAVIDAEQTPIEFENVFSGQT